MSTSSLLRRALILLEELIDNHEAAEVLLINIPDPNEQGEFAFE